MKAKWTILLLFFGVLSVAAPFDGTGHAAWDQSETYGKYSPFPAGLSWEKHGGQLIADWAYTTPPPGFGSIMVATAWSHPQRQGGVPVPAQARSRGRANADGGKHHTPLPPPPTGLTIVGHVKNIDREPLWIPARVKARERRFHPIIVQTARRYNVEAPLVKAIVMAESKYNPKAVSKRGAKGLMQLMPGTARDLGVKDIFDPADNIEAGVRYFRELIEKFNGNVIFALAAYNAGSRKVRQYKGIPPFKATRRYIEKVFAYYFLFRQKNQKPHKERQLADPLLPIPSGTYLSRYGGGLSLFGLPVGGEPDI
jgi:hypothetical protein